MKKDHQRHDDGGDRHGSVRLGRKSVRDIFAEEACFYSVTSDLNADAGDVTQDAFLRVHKSMHTFRRNGKNLRFRFWFHTVMKSAIIDYRREEPERQRSEVLALIPIVQLGSSTGCHACCPPPRNGQESLVPDWSPRP